MQRNASSASRNEKWPRLCDPRSLTSGLMHYAGVILAILGTVLLLRRGLAHQAGGIAMASYAVYGASMILLYAASGTYHTFYISDKAHRILRKIDHCMIYLLVAGTYTPICAVALGHTRIGPILLACVWAVALDGIIVKAVWFNAPRWLTTASYIALGWAALIAIVPLAQNLAPMGLFYLFLGGVAYTVGGVFYALKIPRFHAARFGSHEFFHILILLGSICHFIMIYVYVA